MVGLRHAILIFLLLVVLDSKATSDTIPDSQKRLVKYGLRQLKDLELHTDRLGQIILGAVLGSSVGTVSGINSAVASGGHVEAQDMLGNFWAGLGGGAMAGYSMDREGLSDADILKKMEAPASVRIIYAKTGFQNGFVVGGIIGAFSQLYSGSSDEGGSSASSGSSFSSSANGEQADGNTNTPPKKSGLMENSANLQIFHNSVSGGVAGAVTGYFQPEIMRYGGLVGQAAKDAAHATKKFVQDEDLRRQLREARDHLRAMAEEAHGHIKRHVGEVADELKDVGSALHERGKREVTRLNEKRKEIVSSVIDSITTTVVEPPPK